ncbi:MAG: FAD-dependent oxidoreductase [Acidobacteriota bacterium]
MHVKPTILTVDDDPQVLRAVARDLRQRYADRYRILRATSGQEALATLDELDERNAPVALVLSDQRMPGMEGVQVLAAVRKRAADTRRVLLTAYADTNAAIDAINQSHIDHYLLKPWDPPEDKLYPVLDELLESWQAAHRPGYAGVRIVADRWSAEAHALKDFLARNHVPYRFLDVERDDEALALLGPSDDEAARDAQLPLVLLPDGPRLTAPSTRDVAQHLGLRTQAAAPFYDLAIVGGGPAGLAGAVYGGSEGLRTVLLERQATGGQAGTSSRIENYLGFPSGLSGSELARRATIQAQRFEVEILTPQEVTGLGSDGPYRILSFADGTELRCHTLLLCLGVDWRRLPAANAEALTGRGVYYGAALTEAIACRGETVYTIGAGNSAGQAALHFALYAERVVMLVRGGDLASKMSRYLVDRIEATENIEVRLSTEVTACHGDDHLERLTLRDRIEDAIYDVEARYLFIFIGAAPRTAWLDGLLARDAHGFLRTGADLTPDDLRNWPLPRDPFLLECNIPGVFAAGDVRHQSIKRVASAVGEGSVAIHFVHRHLSGL